MQNNRIAELEQHQTVFDGSLERDNGLRPADFRNPKIGQRCRIGRILHQIHIPDAFSPANLVDTVLLDNITNLDAKFPSISCWYRKDSAFTTLSCRSVSPSSFAPSVKSCLRRRMLFLPAVVRPRGVADRHTGNRVPDAQEHFIRIPDQITARLPADILDRLRASFAAIHKASHHIAVAGEP
ncbi:MAG: hypothetical protein ACTFAK_08540 [Candidatus Electronema sp. VV]